MRKENDAQRAQVPQRARSRKTLEPGKEERGKNRSSEGAGRKKRERRKNGGYK